MVLDRQSTDTIARVPARDLFLILRTFDQSPESTMENVRLRLCHDRKKKRRGTFLWSTARDILGELDRLGYVSGVPSPKTASHFEEVARNPVLITEEGRELLATLAHDRADAYDELFKRLYARHKYIQAFVGVVGQRPLLAPVISSMKEHISQEYSSAALLAEHVANGRVDVDGLLECLAGRIGRALAPEESDEIRGGVRSLLREAALSAAQEETARFAKNFMEKLNQIVIPALFRADGIGFDYRTHRALWGMGEEFRLWCVTRSHPEHDGWWVYPTARIELSEDGGQVMQLVYNAGLERIRDGFLRGLFDAYEKLQALRNTTSTLAWELRAVFCVDNGCQTSVFNRVFSENYAGSGGYRLQLEIERNKPQHETALRAGDRNIGTIRVVKVS